MDILAYTIVLLLLNRWFRGLRADIAQEAPAVAEGYRRAWRALKQRFQPAPSEQPVLVLESAPFAETAFNPFDAARAAAVPAFDAETAAAAKPAAANDELHSLQAAEAR